MKSSLGGHVKLATTPNITTEVSNLLKCLHHITRQRIYNRMNELIDTCVETYVETNFILIHPNVVQFGLTDIAILTLAERGCTVLAADGRLADYPRRQGLNALGFDRWTGR